VSTPDDVQGRLDEFASAYGRITGQVRRVIVGHTEVTEGVMLCLLTAGHAILEGVPGIGKTLLVRTLAEALDLKFRRIQFTPDLMPADITGTNVIVETEGGRREWEFRPGPLFGNLILADEINRATPKTQSAVLEAMQEQTVSVARVRHRLPSPFFVLATQNPLEMEGTFPLPEPQLDRFFFKVLVDPPTEDEIEKILERTTEGEPPVVMAVADDRRILQMRQIARRIPIASDLRRLAVSLVAATHPDHRQAPEMVRRFVRYGSSPRGAQALVLAAKVRAVTEGGGEVSREDLWAVAHAALRHRLILNFEGQAEEIRPDLVIDYLLEAILGPPRDAAASPSDR